MYGINNKKDALQFIRHWWSDPGGERISFGVEQFFSGRIVLQTTEELGVSDRIILAPFHSNHGSLYSQGEYATRIPFLGAVPLEKFLHYFPSARGYSPYKGQNDKILIEAYLTLHS